MNSHLKGCWETSRVTITHGFASEKQAKRMEEILVADPTTECVERFGLSIVIGRVYRRIVGNWISDHKKWIRRCEEKAGVVGDRIINMDSKKIDCGVRSLEEMEVTLKRTIQPFPILLGEECCAKHDLMLLVIKLRLRGWDVYETKRNSRLWWFSHYSINDPYIEFLDG